MFGAARVVLLGSSASFDPADFGTAKGWWEADDYAAGTAANKIVTGTPAGSIAVTGGSSPTANASGWGSTPTVDFDRATDDRIRAACSIPGERLVVVNVMNITSVTNVGGQSIFFSFVDAFWSLMQGVVSTFPDGLEYGLEEYGFASTVSGVRISTGKQVWIIDKYANGTPSVLYVNGTARASINTGAWGDRHMNYLYVGSIDGLSQAGAQRWKSSVVYEGGVSSIAALNTAVSAYYGV